MTALLVILLALVLRVGWVLLVPTKPVGDFAMYVESAAHLLKFGSLDPEYIFMPGYPLLLAAVQALGGGWLACKLVGAVAGSLAAGAVFGIARRLWESRAAALVAGLLCALWPAGVAMASVTGTDMPAAAFITFGCYFLLHFSPERPRLAAVLFGVFMGLATYVRAIALPLCALAVFCLRASGLGWKSALRSTAISCAVAALLLAPWAVRNRLRYGETFVSDSHGGETALVGADPNSDGRYSRSLNRMFHEATGYAILAEPHREADRAALSLARRWMRSTGRSSAPACCPNRRSVWPAVGVLPPSRWWTTSGWRPWRLRWPGWALRWRDGAGWPSLCCRSLWSWLDCTPSSLRTRAIGCPSACWCFLLLPAGSTGCSRRPETPYASVGFHWPRAGKLAFPWD